MQLKQPCRMRRIGIPRQYRPLRFLLAALFLPAVMSHPRQSRVPYTMLSTAYLDGPETKTAAPKIAAA